MTTTGADDLNQAGDVLVSWLQAFGNRFNQKVAVQMKEGDAYTGFTFKDLDLISDGIGRSLRHYFQKHPASGKKDALPLVAILSESRPDWPLFLLGCLRGGVTLLALEPQLKAFELLRILRHSEPRLLFYSPSQESAARTLCSEIPELTIIPLVEYCRTDPQNADRIGPLDNPRLMGANDAEYAVPNPDDIAVLVYTSGTMGNSKGISTTVANLVFQMRENAAAMQITDQDHTLSILPINHLFELTAGTLSVLYVGATVTYANSRLPHELIEMMQSLKVTTMVGVPLFFQAMKRSIDIQRKRLGLLARTYLDISLTIAPRLPINYRRRLFRPLHQRFGGSIRYFVSGGGPLSIEVARFFNHIGLPVLQGYGLSETSPVVSCNTPTAHRLGSVGRPLPGTEVRISDPGSGRVGEILVRGPQVMKGYYRNETLTLETIDQDKWLHTGDLGYIDREGYLYITGRKKNLIVLGGAKKIHAEELDEIFSQSPLVEEICTLGISAVRDQTAHDEIWLVCVPNKACKDQFTDIKAMRAAILETIGTLAEGLASFKRPHHVVVRQEPLPRTATAKVKTADVRHWLETEYITKQGVQPS